MRKALVLAALLATGGFAASAFATAIPIVTTPAADVANPGLITINSNGTVTIQQPGSYGGETGVTYDGADDVVYNVVNNDAAAVLSLGLSGIGIVDFDGDGIDHYANPDGSSLHIYQDGGVTNPDTTLGPDYAGYDDGATAGTYNANFFTNVVDGGSNPDTVVINFGGAGILTGHSAFFSLEAETGVSGLTTVSVNPTVPLPPAVWSGLALVVGIAAYSRFAKTKIA